MAEQENQHFGDGQDNPIESAKKIGEAAKRLSEAGAEKAAAMGGEATANAAIAGAQAGSAAAEVAAGTAGGGPVGAAVAAVWASRHAIYKVLICISLITLFFLITVISLPSVFTNNAFNPENSDFPGIQNIQQIFNQLSGVVTGCVKNGYEHARGKVGSIINSGGYAYRESMDALIDNGQTSANYDICYILAAYSVSKEQKDTSARDMEAQLNAVMDKMFPVTSEEKTREEIVPVIYPVYKKISATVATEKDPISGTYEFSTQEFFIPNGTKTTTEEITVDTYTEVPVEVLTLTNGNVTGSEQRVYYKKSGTQKVVPEKKVVKYVVCTIHPFDTGVILSAFGIDPDATYGQFNISCAQAIQYMASALQMTLYDTVGGGNIPPLTDAETLAYLNTLDCSLARKSLLRAGFSLVGKIPYFWGGVSPGGWNDEWNTPKLVTAAGSSQSGTLQPFGLDCSGFTDWCYKTVFNKTIYNPGSWSQWDSTVPITEAELKPGDLGFMEDPHQYSGTNHMLMYAGMKDGRKMWIHSEWGTGVTFSSPNYVKFYRRVPGIDLESNDPKYGGDTSGEEKPAGSPLYELTVDVTHYCACSICCGQWADGGTTASGKQASATTVAMSSYYPFGTQIMINGTMYTVEDRGGSGIENDKSRVDIFISDHNRALQLGRFKTTAYIYRLGW